MHTISDIYYYNSSICFMIAKQYACILEDEVKTTVCTDIKKSKTILECGMCLSHWSLLLVSEEVNAAVLMCVCVCVCVCVKRNSKIINITLYTQH